MVGMAKMVAVGTVNMVALAAGRAKMVAAGAAVAKRILAIGPGHRSALCCIAF